VSWGDCIIAVAHLPAYQHEALHIFCPLNCREILKTSRVAAFLEFCFWLLARLRDGEWELMNAQGHKDELGDGGYSESGGCDGEYVDEPQTHSIPFHSIRSDRAD